MSEVSVGVALIAEAMLKHINEWPGKPSQVKLKLEKKAVSMMMQPLSGVKTVRKYVNGSFRGLWPFALYVRISGEDSASRLDALKILNDAAAWLESSSMPVIDNTITAEKIEAELPSQAAQYQDGTEDYQVILRLTFYQRRI